MKSSWDSAYSPLYTASLGYTCISRSGCPPDIQKPASHTLLWPRRLPKSSAVFYKLKHLAFS